jgi:hypothetical protein
LGEEMKLETVKLKKEILSEAMKITGKKTSHDVAEFALFKNIESAPEKTKPVKTGRIANYKFHLDTKFLMDLNLDANGKTDDELLTEVLEEKYK